jgi:hypothetical protein
MHTDVDFSTIVVGVDGGTIVVAAVAVVEGSNNCRKRFESFGESEGHE